MARIYSRVGTETNDEDMMTRERPVALRHAAHTSRDAEFERPEELHVETNARRWINPTSLDAPKPRPGFVQRWIASDEDGSHWMKKAREGWVPRDPATLSAQERQLYQTVKQAGGPDLIRVAKLVLCEMPIQVARSRKEALGLLQENQMKSIPESVQELTKRGGGQFGPVKVSDQEFSARGRQSATMVG